jgi:hypothetical protein
MNAVHFITTPRMCFYIRMTNLWPNHTLKWWLHMTKIVHWKIFYWKSFFFEPGACAYWQNPLAHFCKISSWLMTVEYFINAIYPAFFSPMRDNGLWWNVMWSPSPGFEWTKSFYIVAVLYCIIFVSYSSIVPSIRSLFSDPDLINISLSISRLAFDVFVIILNLVNRTNFPI